LKSRTWQSTASTLVISFLSFGHFA
jgi:hypothetical protein